MSEVSKSAHPPKPDSVFFGKAYTAIVRDRTLPRNVRTLYAYFTTYCTGDDRVAFPGRDLIAEDVDLSVRAVNDAIRIGEDVKLWTITKSRSAKGYDRNRYHLHDKERRLQARHWTGGAREGSNPGAHHRATGKICRWPQAKTAGTAGKICL